jgi:hypothetical protein
MLKVQSTSQDIPHLVEIRASDIPRPRDDDCDRNHQPNKRDNDRDFQGVFPIGWIFVRHRYAHRLQTRQHDSTARSVSIHGIGTQRTHAHKPLPPCWAAVTSAWNTYLGYVCLIAAPTTAVRCIVGVLGFFPSRVKNGRGRCRMYARRRSAFVPAGCASNLPGGR